MTGEDPVLTVKEVAIELRCSKPHVYKAIRGELPGVSRLPVIPMGRKKLILRSRLEQWKRENDSGSPDGNISRSSELRPLTH